MIRQWSLEPAPSFKASVRLALMRPLPSSKPSQPSTRNHNTSTYRKAAATNGKHLVLMTFGECALGLMPSRTSACNYARKETCHGTFC